MPKFLKKVTKLDGALFLFKEVPTYDNKGSIPSSMKLIKSFLEKKTQPDGKIIELVHDLVGLKQDQWRQLLVKFGIKGKQNLSILNMHQELAMSIDYKSKYLVNSL